LIEICVLLRSFGRSHPWDMRAIFVGGYHALFGQIDSKSAGLL
jgi:hypothetical protein